MRFTIRGHENVLSTHKTTLEFTKDTRLTLKGDCILGVGADFSYEEIAGLLSSGRIKIAIKAGPYTEIIAGNTNKEFSDRHEIVLRKGSFVSDRTLATGCDKSAIDLPREMVNYLKDPQNKAEVTIDAIP